MSTRAPLLLIPLLLLLGANYLLRHNFEVFWWTPIPKLMKVEAVYVDSCSSIADSSPAVRQPASHQHCKPSFPSFPSLSSLPSSISVGSLSSYCHHMPANKVCGKSLRWQGCIGVYRVCLKQDWSYSPSHFNILCVFSHVCLFMYASVCV